MATQSFNPRLVPCWRLASVPRCALVLSGLLLAAAPLPSLGAAEGAVHFVAPARRSQGPIVLAAATEPVALASTATSPLAPVFVPPATQIAAPVGQPKRLHPPIQFISPASRAVCAPFSLINPIESAAPAPAPGADQPTPQPVASDAPAPRTGEVQGISEFELDYLLEPLAPSSILQSSEVVAPPASPGEARFSGPGAPGADSPMDPLEFNTRQYLPITSVTTNITLPQGLAPGQPGSETKHPDYVSTPEFSDPRFYGAWPQSDFQWAATCFCHRPLYFEEINLERYGYTVSPVLQPFISGAHFFATIPALPYKMARHCPRECIYTLGHYRPGDCVPRRCHHELWDPGAAVVEGGVVTGLIFLIP